MESLPRLLPVAVRCSRLGLGTPSVRQCLLGYSRHAFSPVIAARPNDLSCSAPPRWCHLVEATGLLFTGLWTRCARVAGKGAGASQLKRGQSAGAFAAGCVQRGVVEVTDGIEHLVLLKTYGSACGCPLLLALARPACAPLRAQAARTAGRTMSSS